MLLPVLLLPALLPRGAAAAPAVADELWLRQGLVADPARLAGFRATFAARRIAVTALALADAAEVAQLRTAAEELQAGLGRLLGVSFAATCCGPSPPPPRGLYAAGSVLLVEVGDSGTRALGTEGFEIGRTAAGDVRLRADTASGALYGSFRLLSYVQRGKPVPALLRDSPQMELRVWDLWDDLSGDVTRGFGGDSLIWPQALWRDPDTDDGPPPTKLFVAPCNATDKMQHWAGASLSQPGVVSGLTNGNGECVTAVGSRPSVAPCATVVGSNPRNQFWYNATALQLSIGPLAPGVGGRGRTCFDVNHAQGPDIDTYHCHPLYRGGGGERDYHNQ